MPGQDTADMPIPANCGWWSTRTGAAQVGLAAAAGALGVTRIGVGEALGWGEDCAFEGLLHAARISTAARTANLMYALTPSRNISYGSRVGRYHSEKLLPDAGLQTRR